MTTATPIGVEFQVNASTRNFQNNSSVTALSDGGFVVTWMSDHQDGGQAYNVYGQRYDSTGAQVGSEFQVNSFTSNSQDYPCVTGMPDGRFLVTWMSWGQDGAGRGIYGQLYDARSIPIGSEFLINTHTGGDQSFPSVMVLQDGGFVVTWMSWDGQDGSGSGVYGQRYDSSGAPTGSEFQVNTYTSGLQGYPSTTALLDGGFVITWESTSQDGSAGGIYGQRYNSSGSAIGSEFRVNTFTAGEQFQHSTTRLADGGFVVTWASDRQDGPAASIYGQRYDGYGTPVGSEFHINTYTQDGQVQPSVAALSGGGFIVAWTSDGQDGSDHGIYAQCFDQNGNPVGSEFRVNTSTQGSQLEASVAGLADGTFVITWSSYSQGSENSIYGQRFHVPIVDESALNPPIDADLGVNGVGENAAAGTLVGITAHAVDADATQNAVTYSLVNPTGEFTIDPVSGVVSVAGVIDREAGATRIITIQATSADGSIAEGSLMASIVASGSLITGTEKKDILQGTTYSDQVLGGGGKDELFGNKGSDYLYGDADNDSLSGGSGQDTLEGGAGRDLLTGGAGADRFALDVASKKGDSTDSILDFTIGDYLAIYGSDSGLAKGSLDPSWFELGASATKSHAELLYDDMERTLSWDSDGIGPTKAIVLAKFESVVSLHYFDILVL